MTIIEANKELERIDNELELYLTKKGIINLSITMS